MPTNNATIISNIFLQNSSDYQQRVPDPTQASVAQTAAFLLDPMNRRYYNEFVDTLVNRIGLAYVHQQSFDNPLAVFKKPNLNYGSTIQEMQVGWIRAHSYNAEEESLLKLHRPDVAVAYHTVNRQDYYPISVGYDLLRQAFTEEYGLNNLIAQIMAAPKNSDEYDEFNIMKELLNGYNDNYGFFNQQITNSMSTDPEAFAKELLRAIKTFSSKFTFPTSTYSTIEKPFGEYPVFAPKSEQILITNASVSAVLDVDAYASLFNIDKAEVPARVVEIDDFSGFGSDPFAILTTTDFFMCADNLYQMGESFYNPQTLTTNYYLHHWGVYSVSPFVPAVMFSADASTNVRTVRVTKSEFSAEMFTMDGDTVPVDGTGELNWNTDYKIVPLVSGSVVPSVSGVDVRPETAVVCIEDCYISVADGIIPALDVVHVDRNNVLHVGNIPIEGDSLLMTIQIKPVGYDTQAIVWNFAIEQE